MRQAKLALTKPDGEVPSRGLISLEERLDEMTVVRLQLETWWRGPKLTDGYRGVLDFQARTFEDGKVSF